VSGFLKMDNGLCVRYKGKKNLIGYEQRVWQLRYSAEGLVDQRSLLGLGLRVMVPAKVSIDGQGL
jgi:hypothetical protein